MSELKQQILSELDLLEDSVRNAKSIARGADKKLDLEVAILGQQVAALNEKNQRADRFVSDALNILRKLKI
jgi:hypothetical protein